MVSSTERQRDILRVLAEEPSTAAELATRIHVSVRQAQRDLAELRARFPSQLREEPDGDARSHRWYLDGLPPEPLAKPLTYLSHDELTAIIAARGLLRHPDARHPGWESQRSAYDGDLSAALHGLLERSGLADEAAAIAPRTLGASRFAVATDPPGAVATIGRALRTGQAVRFRYRNRRGGESDVHVVPMRLVAIRGEYH
ncbi:MAG: HTH domain-containing protein [Planctomycetes bacterium]|nr:HTH domain-containing protein [Planctomycetota bacterium]